MQSVSLIWGLFSLFGMLIGFVPFFGALNWLLIPFAVIGTIVSAIALGMAPDDVGIGKVSQG
jgi:predicted RND superfamily exporter protein